MLCFLRRMLCTRVCMNWSIRRTSRSSGETCTGLWILLPLLHLPSHRTPPKVITLSFCTGLLSGPRRDWEIMSGLNTGLLTETLSERQTEKNMNNIRERGIYKEVVFFKLKGQFNVSVSSQQCFQNVLFYAECAVKSVNFVKIYWFAASFSDIYRLCRQWLNAPTLLVALSQAPTAQVIWHFWPLNCKL